jgi:hypothetical protein
MCAGCRSVVSRGLFGRQGGSNAMIVRNQNVIDWHATTEEERRSSIIDLR